MFSFELWANLMLSTLDGFYENLQQSQQNLYQKLLENKT